MPETEPVSDIIYGVAVGMCIPDCKVRKFFCNNPKKNLFGARFALMMPDIDYQQLRSVVYEVVIAGV